MRTISRLCIATILLLASCAAPHQQEETNAKPLGRESISIAELEKKVDTLVKQLGSENYHEREAAIKTLRELIAKKPVVLEYLSMSIKMTEDAEIKRKLDNILKPYRKWGITITVLKKFPDILKRLQSDDESIRKKIIDELGESGLESAAQPLVRLLGHESGAAWESLKNALVKIGKPAAKPVIKELENNEWNVRYHAAEMLGYLGSKHAVEPLIKTLNDQHHDVRDRAVVALGKIGDKRAAEPLIDMIKDSDFNVRLHVDVALCSIGNAAIKPLIEALKDKHYHIRDGALSLLKKMTKQDFGWNYKEWKKWHEKNRSK